MARIKRTVAAMVAALTAGCALQPVYERPASPVAAYPTGEAYNAAAQAAGGTPAADIGWRNFLTDARLQRLVKLALQNNRDLRVAVLNMERVRAQYRIQRSALYPQVNAAASASARGSPAGVSPS